MHQHYTMKVIASDNHNGLNVFQQKNVFKFNDVQIISYVIQEEEKDNFSG